MCTGFLCYKEIPTLHSGLNFNIPIYVLHENLCNHYDTMYKMFLFAKILNINILLERILFSYNLIHTNLHIIITMSILSIEVGNFMLCNNMYQ